MASYEDEGLFLDLADLGCLQVCVRQYANRTTDVGTYVEFAQQFDGRKHTKCLVPPHMWIGVDIYHTRGSYAWLKELRIPYEWVLVDGHGMECQSQPASRGAGIWAIHKDWESTAPARILLDKAQPTQQWELRYSGTKRTLLVMQCMLAA